jgi:acyl carrier protein
MDFFMNKDAIYEKLKELMISEFKIPADSISLEKHLHDDLQLDSLDMVDLILALSDCIGERIDPTLFKEAGTVQDLVDSVSPLWKFE